MKIRSQKAITMVEIMVSIAIFSFLMAAVYQAFLVGNRSWASYNTKVATQRQARWALFSMGKDLRQAKNILITQDDDRLVLSFSRPEIGMVTYTYHKTGPKMNMLIRAENNKERVIAADIVKLEIDYPTTEAISFDITTSQKPLFSKPVTFNLKEKVTIRLKNV